MYLIGEIRDPKLVAEMQSFLAREGIESEVTLREGSDFYQVFIAEKKDLEPAFKFYRAILRLPKPMEVSPEWIKIKSLPNGTVTKVLMTLCVGLFLIRLLAPNKAEFDFLLFSNDHQKLFAEILRGELWRLWTPIFIHFNFFHILFNMLWLKDLGNILEYRYSKNFFIIFMLVTGLFSNIGQYLVMGPSFGGMSGVVYAMLGLIWMNNKFNPTENLILPKNDVYLMIGWFVLCMTGLLGAIANMAHGIGLSLGILIGIAMGVKGKKQFAASKVLLYVVVACLFIVLSFVADYLRVDGKIYWYVHNYL